MERFEKSFCFLSPILGLLSSEFFELPMSLTPSNISFHREQFRLTNGSAITGTFQATDTLETVRNYIHENRTDGSAPFNLMTTFPRKTYTDADLGTSLQDAGLVPSAVLILTKI